MRRGDRLGRWTVDRLLGRGGNGEVWRGVDEQGREAALKVLRRTSREGAARFAREVAEQVALTQEGFIGVLPVVDFSSVGESPPWMAMVVAESVDLALGDVPSVESVLRAVADVASVLARLHVRGLAHRDVKPQNLFRHRGQWCVGDLGLIQVPDAEPLTTGAKALGPRHFLAPEMLNDAATADGRAGDVYSLAKSLWVLLTAQSFPMPGPHRVDEDAISLRAWVQHPRVDEIDRLLQRSTVFAAAERPPMTAFEDELRSCLEPPPEASDEPDLEALTARINAITDPARLRAEAELDRRRDVNAAFERLKEDVVSPACHAIARGLTGFQSMLTNSDAAVVELPLSPTTWFDLGWAGLLTSTGTESRASVAVAAAARAHSDGTVTLVGLLTVERSHPVAADRREIWRSLQTVPAGSAQQDVLLSRMAVEVMEHLPASLVIVAEILTSRPPTE